MENLHHKSPFSGVLTSLFVICCGVVLVAAAVAVFAGIRGGL